MLLKDVGTEIFSTQRCHVMLFTNPLSSVILEFMVFPISSRRVLLVRALTVFECAHIGPKVSKHVASEICYYDLVLEI